MKSRVARRSAICYAYPAKRKSLQILNPFSRGARGVVVMDLRYRPGMPAIFYGMRAEGMACLRAAQAGGDWTYIDNAYFGRDQYFRVSRNAFQYEGDTRPDYARWQRLGVPLRPWRASGGHVLLCLQSELFHGLMGAPRAMWVADVLRTLRRHTDREIRIREKGSPVPLADDLVDCWAVVTLQSNCAVDAICAGVPAFVLGQSAAAPMARRDLALIERPLYPDHREAWAATLAGQQWTLDEFRDGTAWAALRK